MTCANCGWFKIIIKFTLFKYSNQIGHWLFKPLRKRQNMAEYFLKAAGYKEKAYKIFHAKNQVNPSII